MPTITYKGLQRKCFQEIPISELMLSTIPNGLVRGSVLPKMEIEISLIAHDFDELPAAAQEISDMIIQRAI